MKFPYKLCPKLLGAVVSSLLLLSACGSEDSNSAGTRLGGSDQVASIAVISAGDFLPDNVGPSLGGLPDELSARIMERLTVSQRFTIIERTATRRMVLEQRFGNGQSATDVDHVLEKAVGSMELIAGDTLKTAGELAKENDALKDFQDLGTVMGADYIVYAKLEKMDKSADKTAVPFSDSKRSVTSNNVDVRLYLRTIDTARGIVVGAASLHTTISETLLSGQKSQQDSFSVFDVIGLEAAGKIIDMVYPARIVSAEPWIVNRGANDGAKIGDIYQIHREGKAIKDTNGVQLGRVETEVGSVKLTQVQDNISVLQVISGELALNDLARLGANLGEANSTAIQPAASVGLTRQATNIGAGQLPRLALGLVKMGSTANTGKDADQDIPYFTDTLISLISQTKRFQLIDRQEVDQLLDEQIAQALAENRDLPGAMGTLQGADYLLYGSVSKMGLREKETKLPGSNRTLKTKLAYVEGNIRIVDARSGDIVASRKISVSESYPDAMVDSLIKVKVADSFGEQIVLNLMNAVYPIKVAAVTADGTVYINRGNDGGLSEGEALQAFRPGQAIIDPDTGVQLGVTETALGEVQVFEVEDARAKGSSANTLQIGDLLKRSNQNKGKRTSVAANQTQNRSGANLGRSAGTNKVTLAVGKIQRDEQGNTKALTNINRVTDDLMVKLTNTSRFQLLERSEVDQIIDEKIFNAGVGNQNISASLQNLVGADYLIHGTINEFIINSQRTQVAALGESQLRSDGVIEASLRIVDVHTGKVVAADKIRIDKRLQANRNNGMLINDLLDGFTSEMVVRILGRLYPIKIIGGSGDKVFVNRGEDGGLRMGDQYLVMRPGEEMIDPDTGISFGFDEIQIAKLELTRIEPSRSQAKITSGSDVQNGDILRMVQTPKSSGANQDKPKRKVRKPNF
jgi:curli biogenesis system outer membrane secretion channel CsgG